MPQTSETSPIAVIGAGRMGAALVRALRAAGHPVTVWNRSGSRARALETTGAVACEHVDGAVRDAGLVIVCLSGYASWAALWPTLAAGRLRGKTVVQLSTGAPADADALADEMAAQGARFLDGAIMAYPAQIGTPHANIVLSGAADVLAEAQPALSALGAVLPVGPGVGAANAMDGAILAYSYGATLAFFQSMAILIGHGLDASGFAEVIGGSGGIMLDVFRKSEAAILSGDHHGAEATLDVHFAALDQVRRTAEGAGAGTPYLDVIHAQLRRALDGGHGAQELSAVFELMRPRTPVAA